MDVIIVGPICKNMVQQTSMTTTHTTMMVTQEKT
jgi:hypothetical protein